MRRRLVGGAFAALVVTAMVVAMQMTGTAGENTDGFDAALWQAQRGSAERDNPRLSMVGDLEAKHLEAGMTRQEVEALLGPADRVRADGAAVYNLGVSAFGVDWEAYVVEYGDDGRLTRFYQMRY